MLTSPQHYSKIVEDSSSRCFKALSEPVKARIRYKHDVVCSKSQFIREESVKGFGNPFFSVCYILLEFILSTFAN